MGVDIIEVGESARPVLRPSPGLDPGLFSMTMGEPDREERGGGVWVGEPVGGPLRGCVGDAGG